MFDVVAGDIHVVISITLVVIIQVHFSTSDLGIDRLIYMYNTGFLHHSSWFAPQYLQDGMLYSNTQLLAEPAALLM